MEPKYLTMKYMRITAIFIIALLATSFSREPSFEEMSAYKPILLKKSDLAVSVFMLEAKEFENPGKIYLYGSNVYIVDLYKGIHVIDNSDPYNPNKTGFLHIPGVMDLAIKDSVLYADNAIDLVSVDIRNYPQIEVIDRTQDVFPEPSPPDLIGFGWNYRKPENTVIVGWVKK